MDYYEARDQGPLEEGRTARLSQTNAAGVRRSWLCRMQKSAPGIVWVTPEPGECKRGYPKPDTPVVLTVQTDHLGWEVSADLTGQDGSSIDPVLCLKLHGEWRTLLRREALRVKVECPVAILVPDQRRPELVSSHRGRLVDVSASGCRLRVILAARPGTILVVRFTLPGMRGEMALMSQVVRCDAIEGAAASDLGCRFIQVPDEASVRLREWFGAREEAVAS